MRAAFLVAWSALAVPRAFAQSLQSVLLGNGFARFAAVLDGHPVHVSGSDLIVYAPTDAALERNGGAALARRGDITASAYVSDGTAPSFSPPNSSTSDAPKPTMTSSPPACRLRLRRAAEVPCGIVRETWLEDPAFVNLGPGRNQSVIERSACGAFRPIVFSGLGASVQVIAEDIPFDRGVLRPIGGFVLSFPSRCFFLRCRG